MESSNTTASECFDALSFNQEVLRVDGAGGGDCESAGLDALKTIIGELQEQTVNEDVECATDDEAQDPLGNQEKIVVVGIDTERDFSDDESQNQGQAEKDNQKEIGSESQEKTELESCLICSSPAKSSRFTNFPLLPGCKGSQLLNQQMWSVFIVRKLLLYPRKKFSRLMKETFGVLNPASWFDLCDNCTEASGSAMTVYSKILQLKDELKNLKDKLGDLMHESLKVEADKGIPSEMENIISPREKIREHFKELSIQPLALVPKVEITDEPSLMEFAEVFTPLDDFDEFLANNETEDGGSFMRTEKERSYPLNSNPNFDDSSPPPRKRSRKDKPKPRTAHSDIELRRREDITFPLPSKFRKQPPIKKKIIDKSVIEIEDSCKDKTLGEESDSVEIKVENDSEAEPEGDFSDQDNQEIETEQMKKKNIDRECKICHRRYSHSKTFRIHMANHKIKEFECEKCKYPCASAQVLTKHKCSERELYRDDDVHKCNFCNFSSDSKYKLTMHIRRKHVETTKKKTPKPYSAITESFNNNSHSHVKDTECGQVNATDNNYVDSVDRYKKDGKYCCPLCPVTFGNRHSLMKHLRDHRRKKYVFKCKLCPFPAPTFQKLRLHMKRMHSSQNGNEGDDPWGSEKFFDENLPKPSQSSRSIRAERRKASTKALSGFKNDDFLDNDNDTEDNLDRYKKDGQYHCPSCPVTFGIRQALLRHLRDHRRKKYVFKCKLCPFPAPTFQRLRLHMKRIHSNHNRKSEKAEVTGDAGEDLTKSSSSTGGNAVDDINFEDPDWMVDDNQSSSESSEEEQMHPNKGHNITCELCGRTFTNACYFKRHERLHVLFKHFECPKCKYPAVSQNSLDRHLKYELCNQECSYKTKVYKCDHCEFITNRRYKFDAHVSVHKAKKLTSKKVDEIKLPCKICDRTFFSEESFKMHEKNHEIYKEFTCQKCNYPCANARALKTHQRKNHCDVDNFATTKAPFQCELCPYSTIYKPLVEKHMTNHKIYDGAETADGQWKCHLCEGELVFSRKRQLASHKREVHGAEIGLPVFKCSKCSKSYATKFALEDHFNQIHQNNCKFYCEFCGYGTNNKSTLEKHSAKHKQEKPYVCEHCGTSYKFPNGLSGHIRKHHSGNAKMGSFKCKYCDKEFPNKGLLNLHFRDAHGDVYIHKCDECDNSYMSVASLQLHKKVNHTDNKAECQFCGSTFFNAVYLYSHYKNACKKKPPGFKYTVPRRGKSSNNDNSV